jgi:hypothetical protein
MGGFWTAFWEIVRWPARATLIIVSHALPLFAAVLMYWLLERFLLSLWGETEPELFPGVPLKYLFRVIELAIVVAFGWAGTVSAIRELRRE